MATGSWLNNDGLFVQYGTQKTIPEQAGDYKSYGTLRVMEVFIDLKSLTTSPQVQSLTTFFPSSYNVFIEKVELETDVAAAGGTSLSVGLGYFSGSTYANITNRSEASTSSGVTTNSNTGSYPGVTAISNTAFINAEVTANMAAGKLVTYDATTTHAGGYIGAQPTDTTHPTYVTALAAGTFTEGQVRVRVFYRGLGTIIN